MVESIGVDTTEDDTEDDTDGQFKSRVMANLIHAPNSKLSEDLSKFYGQIVFLVRSWKQEKTPKPVLADEAGQRLITN